MICLDCKADYLAHVTTCPACGKPLSGDPPGDPGDPPPSEFVTILEGWPADVAVAQATLEAAGFVTLQVNEHSWNLIPLPKAALQVPADDAAAARALLATRKPAAPDGPR